MGNVAPGSGRRGRRGRCQGRHPPIATGSDPLEYISNNLVTDLTYTTLGMEALHTVTYPTRQPDHRQLRRRRRLCAVYL